MSTRDAADARATIDELVIADEPKRWEALGFVTAGECCQLGAVRIRLAGLDAGQGIVCWSLRGISETTLDGLATSRSQTPVPAAAAEQPNGVVAIDHVVAVSPDLDRTVTALQGAGLELRRIRELPTPAGAPRQAFFRLGDEVLEVVQEPDDVADADRAARLWGLALIAADLERTASALGERVSPIRPAVQRERRIASLRRSAGLAIPVALMSPQPSRQTGSSPRAGLSR